MKEDYFSPETIQASAAVMLNELHVSARRPTITPAKSALLILDFQDYFLDPASHAFIPSAASILPGVQKLIEAYSHQKHLIIFTQHINSQEDAAMMGVWWHELITADHPLCGITGELDTSRGTLLRKTQYDAYFGTDLQDQLTEKNISQVVICGVMTHLCCETTARSAFMRGFEVFFTVDGTATYNRKYHMAALNNLTHGFARPMLIDDVLAAFGGSQ